MFDGIVDGAALFPPAGLAMDEAIAAHRSARRSPEAWMLARFICPVGRLAELGESLRYRGELQWRLSGTAALSSVDELDGVLQALAEFRRHCAGVAEVELLELALPDASVDQLKAIDARLGHYDGHLRVAVELPRDESWYDTLRLLPLIAAGSSITLAKIRCGGLAAEDFPSTEELAAFILGCNAADLSFKATAGLHEPVRHRAPDGVVHHGFLNLLTATGLADASYAPEVLHEALTDDDPAAFGFEGQAFSWRGVRFDLLQIARARARFIGFGSCSFAEPVAGLHRLGALGARVELLTT
jgi:hypothetical protein